MEFNSNTILIIICIVLVIFSIVGIKKVLSWVSRFLPKPDYSMYLMKIDKLKKHLDKAHETEQILLKGLDIMNRGEQILDIGSWDWDLTKKPDVVIYSDNFAKLFHVPYGGKVTAKELMNIVHTDDRERVNEKMLKVFNEGGSYEVEYRIVMRNERVDLIHARGHAIQNGNNKTIRIFGTITKLKRNVI